MGKQARKIRKISLVEQVVFQLRKDIINLVYPSDSFLPTEMELADQFGTSRLTVRSALQELAKEGLIEITQGRGSIVKNYRTSVGLDLLADLLLASPREMISHGVFLTYRQYVHWFYGKIHLAACRKAKPSDEPELLSVISQISDDMDFQEIWNISFRLYREFLRIADNIFLMMLHNSHVNMLQKLIAEGAINEAPYTASFYQEYGPEIIKLICANDESGVRKFFPKLETASKNRLDELFGKIADNI